MVTIKDMADILGISSTTVSNVIHGKTSEVSQKTVERVEKLMKEYDYVPNINARNLAQNRSKIIGIAVKGRKDKYENIIADPFFGELLGVLESEIRSRGYFMMLYISHDIGEILRYVSTWNVDGLVLVGMLHDDFVRVKSKYKKPMVLVDSYSPRDVADYVNVGLQDEEGGFLMTKYLIQNGHRRIAFLADNMEGVDYYRYAGYKRAFKESGLETYPEHLVIIRPGMMERESSMREIYELCSDFTAFMCCSDYYASVLMCYLKARGIRFPEDLSITGFDNNILARVVSPPLTTVHQNVRKKGSIAVKILLDMIHGIQPEEKNILLPVELVIRESVRNIEEDM